MAPSRRPLLARRHHRRVAEGDSCVEQRRHAGMIEVRDTGDGGTGPVLRSTPAEYAAWLDGAG